MRRCRRCASSPGQRRCSSCSGSWQALPRGL
jgi:hypothetical protein